MHVMSDCTTQCSSALVFFLRSSSFALPIMFDDAQSKRFYLPTVIVTFPGLSKVCFSFFELQISLLNFTTLCLLSFTCTCASV